MQARIVRELRYDSTYYCKYFILGDAEFAELDFAGLELDGPTVRVGICWTGNLLV